MIEKDSMNAAMNISTNIMASKDPAAVALMSIAISLKRIADVVAGDAEHMNLTNGIMSAIEQGILSARNQG